MQVDVHVTGERQTAELLDKLTRRLDDGRPMFLRLVDQLLGFERQRFAGLGARWRKQTKSTLRKDAREGTDPRPLILTGELMRSLTIPGYRGQIVSFTRYSMRFGTRVWYAKFHQKGIGVPKRAVVGLTRVQKAALVHELRGLLLEDL